MSRLFGTDGVRGEANNELTPELGFRLGRAMAGRLASKEGSSPDRRPSLLIGRDTRVSGPMLEAALAAGANSAGVDCVFAGVVPTPGIAFLTVDGGFDAGAMISASHNPYGDNGIKFFSSDGYKLDDDEEDQIEADVARIERGDDAFPRPVGRGVGRQENGGRLVERYVERLRSAFDLDLTGMKIVLDCAHGAATTVAPKLFESLGAEVVVLNAEPDGTNINLECGSTHLNVVADAVRASGADAGFAFDGDADRALAVDETGAELDGDHIMAALAIDRLERGELPNRAIAATTYSNMGLRLALEKAGANVVETAAGDRCVLEAMRREGLALGGEQSGHIILLGHSTTGDGLLTSLALLDVARRRGAALSTLKASMTPLPQRMENVRVTSKEGWQNNAKLQQAIAEGQRELTQTGRLFVRASGTEPVIRVMGEGPDEDVVTRVVRQVARVVQSELG